MSILPAISRPNALEYLKPISFVVTDLNEFEVGNKHHVMDGDENTFANAAFWGAGQGLLITLPQETRIGAVQMVAEVYEGPDFGHCTAQFGEHEIKIDLGEGKATRSWTGDVTFSEMSIVEYARTRIYEVKLWEIVPFEAVQPVIVEPVVIEPTPIEVAQGQSVAKVNAGAAEIAAVSDSLVSSQNIGLVSEYANQQIEYWQAMQLTDPGNGDKQGTLGYFAVSARDFWSQVGELFDVGAHPNVILDQLNIWASYSAAQAGKDFATMQPIDVWFEG